ncbi:prephenate dehydratase [Burkholderia sp. LMG 32019]|uniref:prephenate dehydratase n=1 Tax=Burkholderia sp. LMG 32019 TaxID=3158173 RepID=UPI003C2FF0BD
MINASHTAPQPDGDEIGACLARIDAIDTTILALLNSRCEEAAHIDRTEPRAGHPTPQASWESRILERLGVENRGPLAPAHLNDIWQQIFRSCRAARQPFPLPTAYLGPAGTYSEDAAVSHFGIGQPRLPCATVDEVFNAVIAGTAAYAVVPVENSAEGPVARTLDLIEQAGLPITGEIILPVVHCLLCVTDNLEGVQSVLGHPQALAQCRQWLDTHLPGVERRPVSSNAAAANAAHESSAQAAIASARAAGIYGLQVLAHGIQDDPFNSTRFLVVGASPGSPTGHDRTLVLAEIANAAGSLAQLLAPLEQRGISVTRIETRPIRGELWSYRFYLELAGHPEDELIAAALSEMAETSTRFLVLGSYPCNVSPDVAPTAGIEPNARDTRVRGGRARVPATARARVAARRET